MRMKFVVIMLGLLVSGGAVLGQPVAPQHQMHSIHNPMVFPGLRLTDRQNADANKASYKLQEKPADLRAQLHGALLNYAQLTSASDPDLKTLSSQIRDLANIAVQRTDS